MNITFDNVGLNSSPYGIKGINHEETAPRDILSFSLARERGSIIVDTNYQSKIIQIEGNITGSSPADLENKIDTFKELMSRELKNLDIDYAGGTRRYKATANATQINRQFFHLNYAPFTVSFIIPSGVGEDITATNQQTLAIPATTAVPSYVSSITIGGTAYPQPTFKLTFTAQAGISAVSLLVNGSKITYTGTIAVNDVLVFDTENKKVTLNAVEKDYTGIFPSLIIGNNVWQTDVICTTATYKMDIDYYKKYL
jgi:hypothetical protein